MSNAVINTEIHGSHYPNGNWKSSGNFENNDPTGLRTLWFFDGTKRAEINYKDGQRNVEFTFWHNNGKIKSKGSYLNGHVVPGFIKPTLSKLINPLP